MNYLNELKKLEILHVDNYQYIEIKKLNKDEYLLHQGEKLNYIYILLMKSVLNLNLFSYKQNDHAFTTKST